MDNAILPTANPKHIFIIGSGGREHAIGWKFQEDGILNSYETELYFSPGNAGTSEIGTNVILNSLEEIPSNRING